MYVIVVAPKNINNIERIDNSNVFIFLFLYNKSVIVLQLKINELYPKNIIKGPINNISNNLIFCDLEPPVVTESLYKPTIIVIYSIVCLLKNKFLVIFYYIFI